MNYNIIISFNFEISPHLFLPIQKGMIYPQMTTKKVELIIIIIYLNPRLYNMDSNPPLYEL